MTDNWTTRLRIFKNAYSKGINTAIHNAEQSETYKSFETKVNSELKKQIEFVASDIEMLYTLSKVASVELLAQVGAWVSKYELNKKLGLNIFLYWAGEQGGQAALDKLEINSIFGLTNPRFLEYFDQSANLTISSVDNTTKEWIANKIREGKANGLNPFQISNSLVDDGGFSKIRAERIVLTETAKAMTTVELEASKGYGIQEIIWRTSRDDRVDAICLDLEGKQVKIGQLFNNSYNGPPAHPSCRCFIEQVIPPEWQAPANIWLGN